MTQVAALDGAHAGRRPVISQGYARWALVLLMFVYTSNFLDRTILATLGQPIKVELKISDASLGLLQGFAFALFYTVLGFPIARLADRWNRVNVLTVCLTIWTGMTALCGLAHNFLQLLLCRCGVGVGEAGCSPAAHSLVADYFPPARRSSALAVYSFGIPLGTMIGAVSGGWIAEHMSWRAAFLMVGLPGLVLAVIARLVLREPPRGHSELAGSAAQTSVAAPPPSLAVVARRLFGATSFRHMTAGVTLVSLAGYGVNAFSPAYFVREFHLGLAEVGLVFGIINGVSNGLGTLLGGFLTDWASKHDRRWYGLVPGIGYLMAVPFYIGAYLAQSWQAAALCLVLPGVFSYTYLGPTFGVMHNLVEPRMRASATAIVFFIINFIGLGVGPLLTGFLSDTFAQHIFGLAGLGHFLDLCPGGVAHGDAPVALKAMCGRAGADGVRWAILATYVFGVWGAIHYLLAARRLREDMAQAELRANG